MAQYQPFNKKQHTETYTKFRLPLVPSVYDFRHFSGYTGEFHYENRDLWPCPTD